MDRCGGDFVPSVPLFPILEASAAPCVALGGGHGRVRSGTERWGSITGCLRMCRGAFIAVRCVCAGDEEHPTPLPALRQQNFRGAKRLQSSSWLRPDPVPLWRFPSAG